MQSRGWTVSVDRGNRWRDRERSDTHYTQDHVWERGKGREESAVGEAELCKTGFIFLEKDLRKKRIGIYCWLEDQSSCHSLWLTNSALKNTLILSLFRHLRIARPLYVAQSRKKSVKVQYNNNFSQTNHHECLKRTRQRHDTTQNKLEPSHFQLSRGRRCKQKDFATSVALHWHRNQKRIFIRSDYKCLSCVGGLSIVICIRNLIFFQSSLSTSIYMHLIVNIHFFLPEAL